LRAILAIHQLGRKLSRTCTYKLQGRLDTMQGLLCLRTQGWDGCTPAKFRLR
jgi:hypothetical protein